MATKLYLSNDDAMFTPTAFRGTWTNTSGATTHRLSRARSGGATADTAIDNVTTNPLNRCIARFVSDPLAAQSISGTLDAKLVFRETDAAANMTCRIHIWLSTGDTDTVRATLLNQYIDSTEFAVDAANFSAIVLSAVALSTQSATAGDRIVVEIGFSAANAVSTSYTGAMKFGGVVADADGTESGVTASFDVSPWIQFSGNLDFNATAFYLTNTASPATPSAQQASWDSSASSVDKLMSTSPSGAKSSSTVTETSTSARKDENARFVSALLAAQTIGAVAFAATIAQAESSSSADAFTHLHLYVMKSDGTVRGTLLSNNTGATELSTAVNRRQTATLTSQSVSDGDRLVLEVGTSFTNVSATSFNSPVNFGGTDSQAAVGENALSAGTSSWFQIDQAILFQTANLARSFAVTVG